MSKHASSCCKLKKIKKIHYKAIKKYESYSSIRSSSDYDSYFWGDSEWDRIEPAEQKETNKLDNIVNNNIKLNINVMTP